MKKNSNDLNPQNKKKIYGDPEYSAKEDIYNQEEEQPFDDKKPPHGQKENKVPPLTENLDIPGSELDDADEVSGEEDEENNYYSLGGDDHNKLDEDA